MPKKPIQKPKASPIPTFKPMFIPSPLDPKYKNWDEWYAKNPNPETRTGQTDVAPKSLTGEDKYKVYPNSLSLVKSINKAFPQYSKYTTDDWFNYMETVGKVESPTGNRAQIGSGIGKGYFQMEPNSAKTSYNVWLRTQKELKAAGIDLPTPDFNEDFTKLPKDNQIFYNIIHDMGIAATKRKAAEQEGKPSNIYVNPKDPRGSWSTFHWAGTEDKLQERLKHYDDTIKKQLGGTITSKSNNWLDQLI